MHAKAFARIFLCAAIWILFANPLSAYFVWNFTGAVDCGYVAHMVWSSTCRHANWVVGLLTPVASLAISGAVAARIVNLWQR